MSTINKSTNEDNERSVLDGLPDMCTPAQLHKAGFGSKGLIYKILKMPDGPAYVKLGKKLLIDKAEWISYLKRKTVRRDAIEEETDTANATCDASKVKESAQPEAADTRASAPPARRGRPPLKRTAETV